MFGNNSKTHLTRKAHQIKIQMALEESMRRHGISPEKYHAALGPSSSTSPESPLRRQEQKSVTTSRSPVTSRTVQGLSRTTSEYSREVIFISNTQSRRTYKVCTYVEGLGKDKLGSEYHDIATGNLLLKLPGQDGYRKVHSDMILYDSKAAAIQASNSIRTHLPRALIAFDCWGGVKRRVRDFPSSLYEHSRVIKIEERLNGAIFGKRLPKFDEIGKERLLKLEAEPKAPPPPLSASLPPSPKRKGGPQLLTGSIHDAKPFNRNSGYQDQIMHLKINLPGNCNQHLAT